MPTLNPDGFPLYDGSPGGDVMPAWDVAYNAHSTALSAALASAKTADQDDDQVDTVAELPVTDNWVGRLIWVVEDASLRVCTALPGSWLNLAADTGWITPTLADGWATAYGETPGYRRLNGVVYLRGRATTDGTIGYAFELPAGFRPSTNTLQRTDANGVSVRAIVSAGGGVGQVTEAAVSDLGFSIGGLRPFIADA